MPALDADGTLVPGTFDEETDLAWRNISAIAEAAGYSVREIVYVQCVLADIGNYSAINDWWRRQFPDISTLLRDSRSRPEPSRSARRSRYRPSPLAATETAPPCTRTSPGWKSRHAMAGSQPTNVVDLTFMPR